MAPFHLAGTTASGTPWSGIRHAAFGLAGSLYLFSAATGSLTFGLSLQTGCFPFIFIRSCIFYVIFLGSLSFSQTFGDGSSDIVRDDGNGFGSVIIGRDGEIHFIGI